MRQVVMALACGVGILLASPSWGQSTQTGATAQGSASTQPALPEELRILHGLPDKGAAAGAASATWQNQTAGLSFQPPPAMTEIRKGPADAELVEFVNEEKGWVLKVAVSKMEQPLTLTSEKDAMGQERQGILEMTLAQTKMSNPEAEVLRSDVVTLGEAEVGMIALRYTQVSRKLTQLAIIQKSKTLYYIFNLTTPGRPASAEADSEDPGERQAVDAFTQLLDSVQFLDRASIREDQDERLLRTRGLFANWNTKKIQAALIKEQWLRVLKDGKDIAYSYVVERPEQRGNSDGVLIGIRSRTQVPASEKQEAATLDSESWFYANTNRAHESWSTVVRTTPAKGEMDYITEVGASDQLLQEYPLTVKIVAKVPGGEPIDRELPPFYLPQAMGHLLPRLLPPHQPKTYMFAAYLSDQREVMARYVDVLKEQEVTFNGQKIRAVPIRDRITWEGPITTHYVSPDGKYLGSESTLLSRVNGQEKRSKITVVPTDAATLTKIWVDPNLTEPSRPKDEPQPRPRPKAGVGRENPRPTPRNGR